MTRFSLWAALLLLFFGSALLVGCGGGNSTPLLQGNAAFRAVNVAGYQALGGGVTYAYGALQIAAPTDNTLPAAGRAAARLLFLPASAHIGTRVVASRATDLTYVQALNLYTNGPTFSGNVASVNFYTDSAGTQSAGAVTITIPAGVSNTDALTDYRSYPVRVPISVNLTAGNLPCRGTVLLNLTGKSGANTMTGTLTLTKDNVAFNLNLALSDQFNVTGSITVQESGATIQVTNIQGNLSGPLQCDIAVSPYGWKGTGTLNLLTGQMNVNLNTGTGNSTATADNAGNLTLTYADGTKETVNNALLASLVGSSSSGGNSGGGGGGTSTATYNAPLIFTSDQRTIQTLNDNGQSIGRVGSAATASYWASPTAQAQTLPTQSGDTHTTATGLNDSGQIVGYGYGSDPNALHALYWSGPTATPQLLAVPTGVQSSYAQGINNNGQIVGYSTTSSHSALDFRALYWSSPTAQPQTLQPMSGDSGATATAIMPGGQIVGASYSSTATHQVFWASPSAVAVALAPRSGDHDTTPYGVGPNGLIVGASTTINGLPTAVTWASPTAPAQDLPNPSNFSFGISNALSINSSGMIVGFASGGSPSGGSFQGAVIWKNGQALNLNTLIPTGGNWTLYRATQITDQGWILGTATSNNNSTSGTVQFILMPK